MSNDESSGKQEEKVCGPGCCCGSTGRSGRCKAVVGVLILVLAVVLVAKAVLKNNSASKEATPVGFSVENVAATPSISDAGTASEPSQASPAVEGAAWKELNALSELNEVASETDAVFVFLAAKEVDATQVPLAALDSTAKKIEAQGKKVGLFSLSSSSGEYEQLAAQISTPCVLAMVKGGGMKPVSGEITETKLIQAFVAASSASSCGPAASSGCCPK